MADTLIKVSDSSSFSFVLGYFLMTYLNEKKINLNEYQVNNLVSTKQ